MPYFNCVTVRPQYIRVNRDVVLPEFTRKNSFRRVKLIMTTMKRNFFKELPSAVYSKATSKQRHLQFNPVRLCKSTIHV